MKEAVITALERFLREVVKNGFGGKVIEGKIGCCKLQLATSLQSLEEAARQTIEEEVENKRKRKKKKKKKKKTAEKEEKIEH